MRHWHTVEDYTSRGLWPPSTVQKADEVRRQLLERLPHYSDEEIGALIDFVLNWRDRFQVMAFFLGMVAGAVLITAVMLVVVIV